MHIKCSALPFNVTFREIQLCESQRKYIRPLQCCHISITRPRSPTTRMFAQQFVWTNIKEISELTFLALCGGNPPVTGGFPHKGTVTWTTLPYRDITKLSLLFQDIPDDDIADTLMSTLAVTYSLIARVMGPTSGPSGADRTQMGPMLAP